MWERQERCWKKKNILNIILKIGRAVCLEINMKKMKKTSYTKKNVNWTDKTQPSSKFFL